MSIRPQSTRFVEMARSDDTALLKERLKSFKETGEKTQAFDKLVDHLYGVMHIKLASVELFVVKVNGGTPNKDSYYLVSDRIAADIYDITPAIIGIDFKRSVTTVSDKFGTKLHVIGLSLKDLKALAQITKSSTRSTPPSTTLSPQPIPDVEPDIETFKTRLMMAKILESDDQNLDLPKMALSLAMAVKVYERPREDGQKGSINIPTGFSSNGAPVGTPFYYYLVPEDVSTSYRLYVGCLPTDMDPDDFKHVTRLRYISSDRKMRECLLCEEK